MLWTPEQHTAEPTLQSISQALRALGARQWQIDIAGPIIEDAINRPVPPPEEPPV
jgi:ribonuclease D